MKMSRLTRDGTAEPVSRDQLVRREWGQRNINFPGSADHDEDWQPYLVDPYSCYVIDETYDHVPGIFISLTQTIVVCIVYNYDSVAGVYTHAHIILQYQYWAWE